MVYEKNRTQKTVRQPSSRTNACISKLCTDRSYARERSFAGQTFAKIKDNLNDILRSKSIGITWVKRNKNDHFLLFPVQRKEERKETWFSHRYLKTGSVCQKDVSIDFYGAGVNAMGECWDTLKDRNCTKVIRFGCVPLFGLFLNANFRIVLK